MADGGIVELIGSIVVGIAVAATPLVLAAMGELVAEKAGVLNLGVEGMMIVGALAGFAAHDGTGSATLAIIAALTAGAALAQVFAVLTLILFANQVIAGLAISMLGLGLAALLGQPFAGRSATPLDYGQSGGVVLAVALVAGVWWFLTRSRAGLVLRAIGENPQAAHAIGLPVVAVRFAAVVFGGALAGLGGAYLSLVQTPLWAEGMTAGRGWIALALVVFSGWRPWRLLAGAWLFGGLGILQLHAQGQGLRIPAQYLTMLPYLATIVVLVLIARDKTNRLSAPASLGKPFYAAP